MINKENDDKKSPSDANPKNDDAFVDVAIIDVQCHILIKDKDTGKVLLNKRG